MTYVAGFKCLGGVVLCGDTMETYGDHKRYVEKLGVNDNPAFPLAIGGAGHGDLIDAAVQEIHRPCKCHGTAKPS